MIYNGKKINFIDPAITNSLNPHKNSKGFCNAICPDQVCGTITKKNSKNISTNLNNRKNNPQNYDFDYDNIPEDNYIVFILESPHIEEFDTKNQIPIGPAQGNTGNNINIFLRDVIDGSPMFLTSLQMNFTYSLVLINAVQYQASQGTKPLDRKLTDENWINFWNENFKSDLIKRIKEIIKKSKDCKIINLCTFGHSGLHYFVNAELRVNGLSFYEGYHPSRNWAIPQRRKIW